MNINDIKSQFPIFSKKINGKPLVYLDSSNSSQKPISVLNSLDYFYKNEFSNIGRSIHSLAVNATNQFEETRTSVKNFINANSKDEIIFSLEVSFKRTLLNPIKFDKPDGLSSIDVSSFDLVIKS